MHVHVCKLTITCTYALASSKLTLAGIAHCIHVLYTVHSQLTMRRLFRACGCIESVKYYIYELNSIPSKLTQISSLLSAKHMCTQ